MNPSILLSRFSREAFENPEDLLKPAETVSQTVRSRLPGVKWRESFAVRGRFEAVDGVEAAGARGVEEAAMIIRGHGHSPAEALVGTPWKKFLAGLQK